VVAIDHFVVFELSQFSKKSAFFVLTSILAVLPPVFIYFTNI